jgi:hypothetical protein
VCVCGTLLTCARARALAQQTAKVIVSALSPLRVVCCVYVVALTRHAHAHRRLRASRSYDSRRACAYATARHLVHEREFLEAQLVRGSVAVVCDSRVCGLGHALLQRQARCRHPHTLSHSPSSTVLQKSPDTSGIVRPSSTPNTYCVSYRQGSEVLHTLVEVDVNGAQVCACVLYCAQSLCTCVSDAHTKHTLCVL